MCPKKVGVTDLFKPQNPGEVVVFAKSAIFAYTFTKHWSSTPLGDFYCVVCNLSQSFGQVILD